MIEASSIELVIQHNYEITYYSAGVKFSSESTFIQFGCMKKKKKPSLITIFKSN